MRSDLRCLAHYPCRLGLAAQEAVRLTGNEKGTGVIPGGEHGRVLVGPRGCPAFRASFERHAHVTSVLVESRGQVDNDSEHHESEKTADDYRL